MSTDEELQKLQRRVNQLYREKLQLEAELLRQGEKLDEKIEQLKQSIPKSEHEKKMDELRRNYERKLSEIELRQTRIHNERGAGRKRIASKEIAVKVLKLSQQGLSQGKIAAQLSDELGIKIGRTTVGEIVRGNYRPNNE